MRSPEATLYIRVTKADGSRTYTNPAYTSTGRLRPHYAIVEGKTAHHPEGSYHIRYTRAGKRVWESAGTDASLAVVKLQRRVHALQGEALGLSSTEPPTQSERPTEPVVPVPAVQSPSPSGPRSLIEAILEYLEETKEHRAHKTYRAYDLTLRLFREACKKASLEQIDRKDILDYVAHLRDKGNAPRTIRNRVDYLQIFLHHFGLPSLLKGKDLPKYTEKKVRAYNALQLGQMLSRADQEESDLLHFLLCTGTREKEAAFACWTDVDFESKTFTVTEHLDLGFRPKDKEEGTIPIPDSLIELLQERRKRYPTTRLIFPTRDGKPNGHMLRIIKALALRAGVNCGHCINKAGKSCSTHPVCKHVVLHKMRKTFASKLSRNNVPARTLMRYLRHSDLETTLKYIADEDDDQLRETINRTFVPFVGGAK